MLISIIPSQGHYYPNADLIKKIIFNIELEGFYIESLDAFQFQSQKISRSVSMLERCAKDCGLKVAINYDCKICFFEKL